jgi:hypothetical protein
MSAEAVMRASWSGALPAAMETVVGRLIWPGTACVKSNCVFHEPPSGLTSCSTLTSSLS